MIVAFLKKIPTAFWSKNRRFLKINFRRLLDQKKKKNYNISKKNDNNKIKTWSKTSHKRSWIEKNIFQRHVGQELYFFSR